MFWKRLVTSDELRTSELHWLISLRVNMFESFASRLSFSLASIKQPITTASFSNNVLNINKKDRSEFEVKRVTFW